MVKTESVCKKCRRHKMKLFLKGDRCASPKCSLSRRTYGPGTQGQGRKRTTEFGRQLSEKQKAKAIYGIRETQFKNYYLKAAKSKTNTSNILIQLLESRLDNAVYRGGLASSRAYARQLVKHGLILVNDKKITIPSYQIKAKDVISFKKEGTTYKVELPAWLNFNKKEKSIEVAKLPERSEIEINFSEDLIIEFYSR